MARSQQTPSFASFLCSAPSALHNSDLAIMFIAITSILEAAYGATGLYYAVHVDCGARPYTATVAISIASLALCILLPVLLLCRCSSDAPSAQPVALLHRFQLVGVLAILVALVVTFAVQRDDNWTRNHPCINHSLVSFIVAAVWLPVLLGSLIYEHAHCDDAARKPSTLGAARSAGIASVDMNWEAVYKR